VIDQFVFIPCRLDRRDARSALIEDADGWPRKVVGPLGRVEGRLVVAARWLREANGRHLVSFGDGQRLWVTYGPGRQENFVPLLRGAVRIQDERANLSPGHCSQTVANGSDSSGHRRMLNEPYD
jgi:hypothetical protein